MRAQTALAVVGDIFEDIDENKIVELLDELIAAMQNQVNSPSEQTQLAVGKSREAVRDALARSRFEAYPPSLFSVLEGMEVEHLLGGRLKTSLEEAFVGNDITPASALAKIKKLRDKVDTLKSTSERYIDDSGYFEIYLDDIEPNEYEIAVVVPRSFVNNELDDFGKELVRIDKLFSVFVEIETGSREDFKIKSISSSDLTVVLNSAPGVALMVAISIERLAVFYERILSIIKLQKEIARFDDMPDGINDQMKSYIDAKIEEGIGQATRDLLKGKMRGVDSGRKNELHTELQNTLSQIAKRLDSGFQFDVRGGQPPKAEEGQQESASQKIDRERYERISEAREKIRSFKIQSKPILSLPREADESAK